MIKLYDRIKELSYVIGTGNITLSGAMRGFSTFSSCYSNGDILFYTITDGTNYELGSGTYVSSSNVIARFPVKTTNSNDLVNFAEGLKEVYVNYPATNAVFNTSGINPVPQNSGLAFWTSSNSLSYSSNFVIDSGRGRIGINKSNPTYTIDIGGTSSNSIVRSSGFLVGNSGIHFPSGNDGTSAYSGGIQLVHFEKNQLDLNSSNFFQLSGIVNQNILLKKQDANTIFAGPSGGCTPPCSPDYPTFRSLVIDDIPDLSSLYYPFPSAILLSGILQSGINTVSGITVQSSGHLNTRITAVSGIAYSVSGILNNHIISVSGHLDTRINNLSNTITGINNNVWNARLSLSSTDSIYSGSGTSLYLTPHLGNTITLYDGSSWNTVSLTSKLVSNFSSLYANTIYDVFGYLNNGDISFELVSWIMYSPFNDEFPESVVYNSYRSVNLDKINGVYCKSGSNTKRYIGTVRTNESGFIDNNTNRLVYNANNRVKKYIRSNVDDVNNEPYFTFSWIYNSDAHRKIPYIPEISVINGLESHISAKVILDLSIAYARSEYTLGIIRSPETYFHEISSSYGDILEYINNPGTFESYEPIVLYNTNGLVYTDTIGGDYQDGITKTLCASIECSPVGYERYYAIERSRIGSPMVYGDRLLANYGIMGTYEC